MQRIPYVPTLAVGLHFFITAFHSKQKYYRYLFQLVYFPNHHLYYTHLVSHRWQFKGEVFIFQKNL